MSEETVPWPSIDASAFQDMDYLLSEEAQARYVLAAHYVRECPCVVEIGGFKTPISGYLQRAPEAILVLDPLIPEYHAEDWFGTPCRVDHVPGNFQSFDFQLPAGDYGLVVLGCSLKHFSEDPDARAKEWAKLVALIDAARVTVLEFARDWTLGRDGVENLVAHSRTRLHMSLDLDIAGETALRPQHSRRRLVVLHNPQID